MPLTQQQALERSGYVKKDSINYVFLISLSAQTSFKGHAQIQFDLSSIPTNPLLVDFNGRLINKMVVNCKEVEKPNLDLPGFIQLDPADLVLQNNSLIINYECDYTNDGAGCVVYSEKEDDVLSKYLYTQFEPYDANKVFPCFDQPDLKAPMELTVLSPLEWTVFSNENTTSVKRVEPTQQNHHHFLPEFIRNWIHKSPILDTFLQWLRPHNHQEVPEAPYKITSFKKTERISTYLYCFVAGNYRTFTEEGPIPQTRNFRLTIASIVSYQKDLEKISSFIFKVTSLSIDWFQKFFHYKYPFSKFDQIWVHEYAAGAMENAGIVTYNDARCLFKDDPTNNQLFDLANTIVHELSHHWFGNLVTMKWWDDLWLNESFADFISYFCLNDIAGLITQNGANFESGLAFMVNRTLWGYTEDERESTTHPIRATVADTEVASSIFDGITYAKGAASLQQLLFLMGRQNFSAGLGDYFRKFQWSNATADEFIAQLSKHFDEAGAGFTLEQWNNSWLKLASLNVFQVTWDPADVSNEAVVTARQRPYSKLYPELRHHRVKVGLFDSDAKCTELTVSVSNQEVTHIKYDGSNNVKAVLFNHHNQTFAEAYIDDISLSFFRANLNKISDTLTRTSIWFRIISMVENSRVSVSEFTAWANQLIFDEPQDFLLDQVLTKLRQAISANLKMENRGAQLSIIYKHLLSILSSEQVISSARLQILKGKLISFAGSAEQIHNLNSWLNSTGSLAHRSLDLGEKWNIVQKVYTLPDLTIDQKKVVFDAVAAEEKTDRRDLVWNTCKALVADDKEFGQIYELFRVGNSPLSVAVKESHAAGWRSSVHYEKITNEYRAKYFADIAGLKDVLKGNHFKTFYDSLRPIDDDLQDQVNHYKNATLSLTGDHLSKHYRDVLKIIDDLNRRSKNYQFNDDTDNTLTQTRAEARFKLIGGEKINYNVHLAFEDESLSFTGLTEISFILKELPEIELPVDLTVKSIKTLLVNGVHAVPITRGEFLILKKEWLHVGENTVAVLYTAGYYNDGYGCIYYRDSESKQLYLYTTFQPRSAYKVFPCFDQPDLKAQITFNCIGQIDKWKIISNEAPIHVSPFVAADYKVKAIPSYNPKHDVLVDEFIANQKGTFYIFPQTRLLPTYLYCLIVGDYYELDVKPEEQFKTLPMKLYCIQSLHSQLQKLGPFIFEITRLSLAFFEKNFGYDYPFSKYDQVFAHEYKMGAMENPGVVTFNDTYLYKEAVPTEDMLVLANTIAHQASHHWFGDLVTMKWWNDLWLNESFADFISHYCLEKIHQDVKLISYNSGWAAFVERKVRGYTEDQMVTTHPIRGPVPNTSVAGSIFDGITYQKGASTLKQLMFVMGEEAFFSGLKKYFKQMEWKNGTIDDFLSYMKESFDSHYPENYTLDNWKEQWLLTSSLNVFEVQWDANNHSADAVLTLKQKALTPAHNYIRHHKLVLGFFRKDHSVKRIEVNVDGLSETKVPYDGSEQFVAVLVNLDDQGFVKYRPDPASLAYFRANINKIEDQVTRILIWHHLNQLVRDSILLAKDYTETALANIFDEKEDRICKFVFNFLQESSLFQKEAGLKAQRDLIFKAIYDHLVLLTSEQQIKSNRAIILRNQLVRFPVTQDQIHTLEEWRSGKHDALKHLTPSINQGWTIVELVYTSSKYTLVQKQNIFKNQETWPKTTSSDIAVAQIICDGIVSSEEKYEQIYQIFHKTDNSVTVKRVYASGWATKHHLKRMVQYKQKYFKDIVSLSTKMAGDHFNAFYDLLKPIDEDLDINIALFEAIQLDSDGKFDSDRTSIKKIVDLLKRRRTAHAFNA